MSNTTEKYAGNTNLKKVDLDCQFCLKSALESGLLFLLAPGQQRKQSNNYIMSHIAIHKTMVLYVLGWSAMPGWILNGLSATPSAQLRCLFWTFPRHPFAFVFAKGVSNIAIRMHKQAYRSLFNTILHKYGILYINYSI